MAFRSPLLFCKMRLSASVKALAVGRSGTGCDLLISVKGKKRLSTYWEEIGRFDIASLGFEVGILFPCCTFKYVFASPESTSTARHFLFFVVCREICEVLT